MNFQFTKDSKMVKDMLLLMNNKGLGIEDVETFIPNVSNLQEVVKQCLEDSLDQ